MWLCQVRQVPGLISQAQNQGCHLRFLKGKTTTVQWWPYHRHEVAAAATLFFEKIQARPQSGRSYH